MQKKMIILSVIGFFTLKALYVYSFSNNSGDLTGLLTYLPLMLPCIFILWRYSNKEMLERYNDSLIKSKLPHADVTVFLMWMYLHIVNNHQPLIFGHDEIFLIALIKTMDAISAVILFHMMVNATGIFLSKIGKIF